ncbi:hypothetical protein [Burkholderia seminalis]|nr:hypothetical protein [Burkholderia seminalis]MDN7592142.1 hypothetical protein [Burkholderia seminalis]
MRKFALAAMLLASLILGGCGLFGCGAAASNGGAFGSCHVGTRF